MRCFFVFTLAFFLSALPLFGAESTTQPAANSEFQQRLESIDRRATAIKDLTADFVQEKHSPLLRKPLISRGTVTAKGSASLWNTKVPEQTIMTCDPKLLRLYYPDRKIVEERPIRGQLGMLAASPLPSLGTIRQIFTLTPDAGADLPIPQGVTNIQAVRMEPSDKQLRQYVDHVRVLLDVDRGLVLAFEMVDPDGEQTVIRFSNVHTDAGLSDDAVKLKLPANVKIVHPLGGDSNQP